MSQQTKDKQFIFSAMPVPKALTVMALPTIASQLIMLVYNMTDTWFIGRTNNPYMVAAAVMVATVYLMVTTVANIFGVGGGNLMVNLLGAGDREESGKVASLSLVMAAGCALVFSAVCFAFRRPLLLALGASENTYGYAMHYLLVVIIIGAVPTVLSNTMSFMLRNAGYAKEAAFGLMGSGILNMFLDPLFMFVLMPDGYRVLGAALATLASTCCALAYFIIIYIRVQGTTVLRLPRRIEHVRRDSLKLIFSIGLPAGLSTLFYDFTTIELNRLAAGHGDQALAAMGIILKVERLPLNIGIGICLGMAPLLAYNYGSGNFERLKKVFRTARTAGVVQAVICVILYYCFAGPIMGAFISDGTTVELGTQILRARCFATPLMFLSFHMVYLMQAVQKGHMSLLLAFVRQIVLNLPIMILLNSLWGLSGMVWSQAIADFINVAFSYIIYFRVMKQLGERFGNAPANV